MSGSRVVYHYHENAFAKGRMYRLLAALMTRIADHVICVSDFQASHITFPHERLHVIPNALSASMASLLNPDASAAFVRKRILMLSSLRSYKVHTSLYVWLLDCQIIIGTHNQCYR